MSGEEALTAVIVAVGTELVADRPETDGPLVAARLAALGVDVRRREVVPDAVDLIREALRRACDDAPLVVVTGGLGPTDDDVTREAVAALAGCGLVHDAASVARLEERARRRGAPPPNATSLRQALVPEGAEAVPNLIGAAPGAILRVAHAVLVALPGPPSELAPMADEALASALRRLAAGGRVVPPPRSVRRIRLAGIGEGAAFDRVAGLAEFRGACEGRDPLAVAWLTRPGEVEVELRSRDAARVEAAAAAIAAALGPHVVSTDGRTHAEIVIPLLAARFETLGVAESCTAGRLGAEITSVPGSSAAFRGGVIAYSDDVKRGVLGVDGGVLAEHGAVSLPVAGAMAAGARRVLRCDWGLSVTGVAGPSGGTPDKPVGTVCFGLALPDGRVQVEGRQVGGDRETVRLASARLALDMLRRYL